MPTVCRLMRTSRGPSASSFSMGKSRRESLCFSSRTRAFTGVPPWRSAPADDDDAEGDDDDIADPDRDAVGLEEAHPEQDQRDRDVDRDEEPVEPVGLNRQEAA